MEQNIEESAIQIAEETLNNVRVGSDSDKNIIRNILIALDKA